MAQLRTPAQLQEIQQFNAQYRFADEKISNSALARKALDLRKLDSPTGWATKQEVQYIKTQAKHIIQKLGLNAKGWNCEDAIKIGNGVTMVYNSTEHEKWKNRC